MAEVDYYNYKAACDDWLRAAMRHPGIWWQTLDEWSAALFGHAQAHLSLEIIQHGQSFDDCFKDWLQTSKGIALKGCLWSKTLNEIAKEQQVEPITLFFELADEFLVDWLHQS